MSKVLAPLLAIAMISGCGQPKPAPAGKVVRSEAPDHAHERGKMLLADAGKYHAALTAHLSSKDGNELDIFFETQDDKNPKPVAIPYESFDAEAKKSDGTVHALKFEAAPADERPKDEKPGAASHFVAKAGWMKPDDTLEVLAQLKLNGKDVTIRWKNFNPKKYAHHED